jgi:hypothetical protein
VVGLLAVDGILGLDVSGRVLVDTDGYMRTVRVVELVDGSSGWFDGDAHRSNAPFGHDMHWTRPTDAALAGLAAPWLGAGAPGVDAVYWSSLVFGPLVLLATGLGMAWASVPLVGRRWAPLAGALAVAQPAISTYMAPGRSDHHALILLVAALAAGAVLRLFDSSASSARHAVLAGALFGIGVWISVEWFFVVGVSGIALGLAWGFRQVDRRPVYRMWWVATLVLVVALVAERGAAWASSDLDRISLVHVALMAAIAAAWWAGTSVGELAVSVWSRLAVLGVAGLVGMAAVVAAFPAVTGGPFGSVPNQLQTRWLDRVIELRPMLAQDWQTVAALVGLSLLGLLVAVVWVRRAGPSERWGWVLIVIWSAAGLILALSQLRWVMYPQLIAGVPLAVGVGWCLERLATQDRLLRVVGSMALLMVALFGWRVPLNLPSGGGDEDSAAPCVVTDLRPALPESGIVLAAIDHGPEILWRTSADVVASPYHRNVDGILDTLDAFEGDESLAKAIVDERGVEVVAVCPTVDGKDYPNAGSGSLFTRLVAGDPPEWLVPAGDPDDAGGFLVFRVVS